MKFQTALIFAAAASFAFAQVSDVENDVNDELANVVESDVEANVPAENGEAEVPSTADAEAVKPSESDVNESPIEEANAINENTPAEGSEEESTDAAEESDDYSTDAAENSDDYGDNKNVDDLDANGNSEESDDEEDSVSTTAIAGAAAGAAATAAGIFLWVKRSKQSGVEDLRSGFDMA